MWLYSFLLAFKDCWCFPWSAFFHRALKLWFIDVLRGLKTVKQIQQVLVRCSATKKLYTDVQGTAMRVQDEERTAEDAVMECHTNSTNTIK